MGNLQALLDGIADVSAVEVERGKALLEMQELADKMQSAITENARSAKDQQEYRRKYDALAIAYDNAKTTYEKAAKTITDSHAKSEAMRLFLQEVDRAEAVEEFDESLWGSLVESLTAYSRDKVVFRFKDGTEITVGA